jgi:3-hydroxyacyl-CoA dehydrogenase
VPSYAMAGQIRTVAVVGCGVIGMSWACLFLAHGIKVIISDPAEGAEENFIRYLQSAWPALDRSNSASTADADNFEFAADIVPRLREADFIQEVMSTRWFTSSLLIGFSEWTRDCDFQAGTHSHTRPTC